MSAVPAHTALDNYGLHHFALLADDDGVRRALRDGADVNALDASGRTAVMCAVAGENWLSLDACDASFMSPTRLRVLSILVAHPDMTLFTLNSPHLSMNGVNPLCVAAWLNQPQAVRVLLQDSTDTVSVDGMDSHGATALMYAARDGNLEVVQTLLAHGARPDFRDRNHRTSVQFSLAHPQILWLCETVLRRHRWRESKSAERTRLSVDTENLVDLTNSSINLLDDLQPPPLSIFTPEAITRLNNTLVSCIKQGDLSFIHSLLFAPAIHHSAPPSQYPMSVPNLVNIPDSRGWSLVHHCVAVPRPSIDILDALYCAGADVSIFTTHEKHTPLHILAKHAQAFHSDPPAAHSLHDFCLHLIQDLRAPLSARDEQDETCLHIAAEHGQSADLLLLLLDCDTTGAVRKMKNSRGLTPVEVAKTEFLFVFGIDGDGSRPESALSTHTIRPTESFASLSSISEANMFSFAPSHAPALAADTASIFAHHPALDASLTTQQLISSLRSTALNAPHAATSACVERLEDLVDDASSQCTSLALHFRARIEEAARAVEDLRKTALRIEGIRLAVTGTTAEKLRARGISPVPLRGLKRTRDSEDSQATFVDEASSSLSPPSAVVSVQAVATRAPVTGTFVLRSPAFSPASASSGGGGYASAGTQTSFLDRVASAADGAAAARPVSLFLSQFAVPSSPTSSKQMGDLWAIEQQLKELELDASSITTTTTATNRTTPNTNSDNNTAVGATTTPPGSPKRDALRLKQVMKKRKKLEEKLLDIEAGLQQQHAQQVHAQQQKSSIRWFKAWFKRMVVPHQPPKMKIVYDLGGGNCSVGREVKGASAEEGGEALGLVVGDEAKMSVNGLGTVNEKTQAPPADMFIDGALRTSQVVLEAVERDLASIFDCLAAAEQFIDLANHSISRTQRVVRRAIKKRELMIDDLRTAARAQAQADTTIPQVQPNTSTMSPTPGDASPTLLGYEHAITSRPSMASISTIYSVASSASSAGGATLTHTVSEADDEDIRVVRRLLLRKIEAQTSGAWDEVDRVAAWLPIVKEAVRSVKRRAYL